MTRAAGSATKTGGKAARPQQTPAQISGRIRLPDGSRSVQSPWVWRGFLFMSLIAFGLFLNFVLAGLVGFAVAWALIAAGWFAIAMWLWRKHVRDDDLAWQAARQRGGRAT
jgi:hypothetical protein